MATVTLNLIQYHSAAKPFATGDFVTIEDTGFSFADLSVADLAALYANNVDAIDARDNALQLSARQYEALGPVALTSGDLIGLCDWSVALNAGTIEQIAGLAVKGIDYIDSFDGKLTLTTAQYAALGSLPVAFGDSLHINGTSAGERIVGRASNDVLKGLNGRDVLKGDFGNDRLFGGAGKDYLTGGAGNDAFAFNTKPSKALNLDRIMDFNVRSDSVYLDNAVFKKVGRGSENHPGKLNKEFFITGTSAREADDHLIYNKQKGILFYDADGSGAGKAVEVALLSKHLKMTYHDFFVI
jgi:Ca2+-binding RTX toxin-like protein